MFGRSGMNLPTNIFPGNVAVPYPLNFHAQIGSESPPFMLVMYQLSR